MSVRYRYRYRNRWFVSYPLPLQLILVRDSYLPCPRDSIIGLFEMPLRARIRARTREVEGEAGRIPATDMRSRQHPRTRLKHEEHQDPQRRHKGRFLTHRNAMYASKVGGSPGQEMRCFVDPSWFLVSFVFQNPTATAENRHRRPRVVQGPIGLGAKPAMCPLRFECDGTVSSIDAASTSDYRDPGSLRSTRL
jgi:hypothetical protein